MEYHWLFVCLWGFLGLAIIHFVDGITEYRARQCSYKEGRYQKTFKNKKFLWRISGIEWDGVQSPPSIAVTALLLPGVLACVTYLLLHRFVSPIPDSWEATVVLLLVLLSSYMACLIYNDFSSQVYLISACCFIFFVLLRFAFLDGLIRIGMDFSTLLTGLLLIYGLFTYIYIPMLGKKFPWKSEFETYRILNRGNMFQMAVVTTWSLVLFYGFFYGLD